MCEKMLSPGFEAFQAQQVSQIDIKLLMETADREPETQEHRP